MAPPRIRYDHMVAKRVERRQYHTALFYQMSVIRSHASVVTKVTHLLHLQAKLQNKTLNMAPFHSGHLGRIPRLTLINNIV